MVFTQDSDFLAIHGTGTPHLGIAYCPKGSRTIGQIIDALALIWELCEQDEMAGRVEYV